MDPYILPSPAKIYNLCTGISSCMRMRQYVQTYGVDRGFLALCNYDHRIELNLNITMPDISVAEITGDPYSPVALACCEGLGKLISSGLAQLRKLWNQFIAMLITAKNKLLDFVKQTSIAKWWYRQTSKDTLYTPEAIEKYMKIFWSISSYVGMGQLKEELEAASPENLASVLTKYHSGMSAMAQKVSTLNKEGVRYSDNEFAKAKFRVSVLNKLDPMRVEQYAAGYERLKADAQGLLSFLTHDYDYATADALVIQQYLTKMRTDADSDQDVLYALRCISADMSDLINDLGSVKYALQRIIGAIAAGMSALNNFG